MHRLTTPVILGFVLISMSTMAAEPRPLSPELQAAQAELDSLRASGARDKMDAETKVRLDAAAKKRNTELDKFNAEWKTQDSVSMLKAQADTCSAIRQGLDEGKKATDYFETLRYAGFSTDEALDVVLQIKQHTPEIGKSVRVAYCILGLPIDIVRSKSKNSDSGMLVYPRMFVHTEDGKVTAWSDR
jgi:hypothetical protein